MVTPASQGHAAGALLQPRVEPGAGQRGGVEQDRQAHQHQDQDPDEVDHHDQPSAVEPVDEGAG